jgi:hypothetical protein
MKKKSGGRGIHYFFVIGLIVYLVIEYWLALLIAVCVFIVYKMIFNNSIPKKDKIFVDTVYNQNEIKTSVLEPSIELKTETNQGIVDHKEINERFKSVQKTEVVLEPSIKLKTDTTLGIVDHKENNERFKSVRNADVTETSLKIPDLNVTSLRNISNTITLNYREENFILQEYQHIRTPDKILKSLKQVMNNDFKEQYYRHSRYYEEEVFVRDSMRFSSQARVEIPSNVVIESRYVTFQMLNDSQKDSYFYWRSQILNGNFSNMDYGYMILFMYELINYSFNQNSAFNISMMIRLHEECDTYEYQVERWISDMLYEVGELELAQKWVTEPTVAPRPSDYRYNYYLEDKGDYIYQKILECNDLHEIPAKHWRGYTRNYRETQFFISHKNEIYKTFEKGIVLLNQVYEQKGIKVQDRWFCEEKRKINRRLFSSAVIGRNFNELELQIKINRKLANETMINEITSLFRLSDNVTRLMYGEKSKIKVDETFLPENFKALMIDTLIPEKNNQPSKVENVSDELQVIDFDLEQISKLQDDSEFIANMIDNEQQSKDVNIAGFQDFKTIQVSEKKPIEINFSSNDVFSLFENDGNGDESSFVEVLSQLEKNFLLKFENMQLTQSEASQFTRKLGVMMGLVVNGINEKAQEYIGDNIIETVGDSIKIHEDYEKVLNVLKEQENEN